MTTPQSEDERVQRQNYVLRLGGLAFEVDFQGEIEITRECDYYNDHHDWLDKAKAQELSDYLHLYLSGACMKCLGKGAKAPNGVEYCNCE